MRRYIKIGIMFLLFIAGLAVSSNVYAASASIQATSKEIYVGESTNVTAKITATEAWTLKLTADGGSLSGNTNNADTYGAEKSDTVLSASFTASKAGTYTIKLTGQVTGSDLNKKDVSDSVKITVKEKTTTPPPSTPPPSTPEPSTKPTEEPPAETNPNPTSKTTAPTLSSNNQLSSLKVSEGTLSPKFSARTKEYTVEVGEEVESIKITANKSHDKASVSGTGTKKLNPGANVFEIQVTAENGSVNIYKITVNKPQPKEEEKKEIELKLKSLVVKGVNEQRELIDLTYEPNFSEDVYIYEMKVENSIESLMIEALAKEEGTVVEVAGNENLVGGENVITIMLKTADGEKSATYQIIAIKEAIEVAEAVVATPEEIPEDIVKSDYWIIIGGVSIGVVLIIIGCTIVVILHKRQDRIEQVAEIEGFEPIVTSKKEEKNKKQEKDIEEDETKDSKKGGRGRHF